MNFIIVIVLCISNNNVVTSDNEDDVEDFDYNEETDVDDESHPYMVAILRKTLFLSAGALIDEKWVLTAADPLFFIREAVRTLRVRLGSKNYKRGGTLTAVKYLHVHPNFDDTKPEFDIALLRLAEDIRITPNLNPIKLQRKPRAKHASHFTVIGWQSPIVIHTPDKFVTIESLLQSQLLSVSHLHPTSKQNCLDLLNRVEVNHTDTIMCLDWAVTDDPCQRDIGAAVQFNGVLWGIVSSWKTENCGVTKEPLLVTLVSSKLIATWIHSTVHGHRWSQKHSIDYNDNFV